MTAEPNQQSVTTGTTESPVAPPPSRGTRWKTLVVVLLIPLAGVLLWAGLNWWAAPRSLGEIRRLLGRQD
jgi:hypothetical protein